MQQPVKQQPKKKIGVPVMMSKSIPRVVLTPLKVNGEHVESASGEMKTMHTIISSGKSFGLYRFCILAQFGG